MKPALLRKNIWFLPATWFTLQRAAVARGWSPSELVEEAVCDWLGASVPAAPEALLAARAE